MPWSPPSNPSVPLPRKSRQLRHYPHLHLSRCGFLSFTKVEPPAPAGFHLIYIRGLLCLVLLPSHYSSCSCSSHPHSPRTPAVCKSPRTPTIPFGGTTTSSSSRQA